MIRLQILAAGVAALLAGGGCLRAGFEGRAEPADSSRDRPAARAERSSAIDLTRPDRPPDLPGSNPDRASDRSSVDSGTVPGVWVVINAQSFSMGAPAGEPCRDAVGYETQHQVTLTHAFSIQSTEVTQAQFQAVRGYNPSSAKSCGLNCPVDTVSWDEAVAYCNALSAVEGRAPCYQCSGSGPTVSCAAAGAFAGSLIYSCPGYRLPSEAEWELAYRAGSTTAYYSGANSPAVCFTCTAVDPNLDAIGWYCWNAGGAPAPVGQKKANAWGLHDMAGNVWEWCHDWWQIDLGAASASDPAGPASGSSRAMRGGAWYYAAGTTRAAHRNYLPPSNRSAFSGLRCVRSLTGS